MKQWILKTFFQKDLDQMYELAMREGSLDAFEKAREDLEETQVYDTDKKAEELSTERLNNLLSNADLHKIVSLDKIHGIIYIGGEKADNARLLNLKSEAEYITNTDLWGLLYETPKELAQRSMFVQGETLDDMKKGKSILYTLSTQQKIINLLKSYEGK